MKVSSAEYPGRPIAVGKELSRSGLQVCDGEAIRRPGHALQVTPRPGTGGETGRGAACNGMKQTLEGSTEIDYH